MGLRDASATESFVRVSPSCEATTHTSTACKYANLKRTKKKRTRGETESEKEDEISWGSCNEGVKTTVTSSLTSFLSRHRKCSRGEPIKIHGRITRCRVMRVSSIRQMRYAEDALTFAAPEQKGYTEQPGTTAAFVLPLC